jgi:hypothetical protein
MKHHTLRRLASLLLALSLTTFIMGSSCNEEPVAPNSSPWAEAGENISTSVGLETALDGTASYDPDEEQTLTWTWSFESVPAESALTDEDITPNGTADAANALFVADQQGLYVVRLRVTDNFDLQSQSDFVHVMADIEGSLPVAIVGDDQSVTEGDSVSLDGTESYDPLGNDLTYRWYLVAVPDTSSLAESDISNGDQSSASVVPDAPGTFLLGLQVNNGTADSVPAFMSIEVTSTNDCPTALAETVYDLHSCTDITVTAEDSTDPDNDVLDYSWRHLLPPFGSTLTEQDFDDPFAEETTFFADGPGTYTLQVSVNDGECESAPFQFDVEITVRPTNDLPVPAGVPSDSGWVSATAPCTESGGNWWCTGCEALEVTIDGSSSTDPDGDPLTFYWENLYDPTVPGWENYRHAEIEDPYAEVAGIELQEATTEYLQTVYNQYEFLLTVTDCMGESVTTAASIGFVYGCDGVQGN